MLFGFTSGIAVATKFSAVPFIALSLASLGLVQALNSWRITWGTHEHHPWRVARSRAAGVMLAGLAALVPLLAVYAVRSPDVSGVEVRYDWAVNYLLTREGLDHLLGTWLSYGWLSHVWLPRELTDLFNGIIAVKAHNDAGHRSYLLGQVSNDGWWYFYFVTLAVKTPLPLLVAGPVGLVWLARNGWRERNGWALAPAVLVFAILAFASVFSRINIGIRHVLILYPFLALGAAYVTLRAWQAGAALADRRARLAGRALLFALVLWQLSTLWRAYPDYLPYFNETVRVPRRVLVDSDLDWGQDLKRLEIRANALHMPKLYLAYLGTADLAREPLPPARAAQGAPAGERLGGDLRSRPHPQGRRLRVAGWVPAGGAHRQDHRPLLHSLGPLGRRRPRRGPQARDAHQRRRVRIVEGGVHRIRGQRTGIVPVQFHERGGQFRGARITACKLIRLEFMAARPQRGQRRDEEHERGYHEHEEQQRRVRRGQRHAQCPVETGLAR